MLSFQKSFDMLAFPTKKNPGTIKFKRQILTWLGTKFSQESPLLLKLFFRGGGGHNFFFFKPKKSLPPKNFGHSFRYAREGGLIGWRCALTK